MSVAPGTYQHLRPHRIPKALGGQSPDAMFKIAESAIASPLLYVPETAEHGAIEPAAAMSMAAYQAALCATALDWIEVSA